MECKQMETSYKYFNRDISWLSFNYRVLLESTDSSLPVYERIKFLSIHASNLEEFYKVRVSEYRDNPTPQNEEILAQINKEAIRQQQVSSQIFSEQLLPELADNRIILYKDQHIEKVHKEYIRHFFEEEIFPFLQPVMIMKDEVRMFLRDSRLYSVVRLIRNNTFHYAIIKIPFAKVPRIVSLPSYKGKHYMMFIDDIIAANLPLVFPGFEIDCCHCIKISRDADIFIEVEEENREDFVKDIMQRVKRRKIGKLNRFVYDSEMPDDMLLYLCETFNLEEEDLIPGGRHLNIENLIKLPNPVGESLTVIPPPPLRIKELDKSSGLFPLIAQKDLLLYYPYHSFDYFIRFIKEAAFDPDVKEIKLTQYRVADKSEVIDALITAAEQGKRVTVFVEIKARFDEENNWYTSELMRRSGIHIVFSLPKLKVHAKIALITRKGSRKNPNIAYISTGNFNEDTARLYADLGLFTAEKGITNEIAQVFKFLEQKTKDPVFNHILVAQFNMVPALMEKIDREIELARQGKKAYIILKMNGIQDERMIDTLYRASEAGVRIDLIVRGICCVIPNQSFSRNIRITRIVDMFLEHARIWYFHNDGEEEVYLASADWLKRNLNRRIEVASPVLSPKLKQKIIDMLHIQLADNVKACLVDENLQNIRKEEGKDPVRSQTETYRKIAKRK